MSKNSDSKTKRYVWTYRMGADVHGGMKARRDSLAILLASERWLPFDTSMDGSKFYRFCLVIRYLIQLWRLSPNTIVFVQYPLLYESRAQKLFAMILFRRFRTVLFLHDLIELREAHQAYRYKFISKVAFFISTGRLHERLLDKPIASVAVLKLWDYRLPQDFQLPACRYDGVILFAGSLWPEKVSWLYRADAQRVPLLLYGAGYDIAQNPGLGDRIAGPFDPDHPVFDGAIAWGLVWDGRKIAGDGADSDYERLNLPHKVSLYLACGLPLIVWDQSVLAAWVVEQGCGILISSLADIKLRVESIDVQAHHAMAERARHWGDRVRACAFLPAALAELGL